MLMYGPILLLEDDDTLHRHAPWDMIQMPIHLILVVCADTD